MRASIDAEAVRGAGLGVRSEAGAGRAPLVLLDELGCDREASSPNLGLRLDADADRLALIDETGADLDSELTLPLAMVAHGARRIVKGADTSRIVDRLAGSPAEPCARSPRARSIWSRPCSTTAGTWRGRATGA